MSEREQRKAIIRSAGLHGLLALGFFIGIIALMTL